MVTQREATDAAQQLRNVRKEAESIRRDRGITRLAHGVEEGMLALRETAGASQDTTLQAIASLTEQLARLIDVLSSNTPTVNVAAAPVSVMVEPGEVILRDDRQLADHAIIHHSDGTTSRIEFENNG